MIRLLVVTILIGVALSVPVEHKTYKKGKYYKFDGIVGGNNNRPANDFEHSDEQHIRNAPQDPLQSAELVPNDIYEITTLKPRISITTTTTTTTTRKPVRINYDEFNQQQAENAHYSFDSSILDDINDQSHVRQETRDGRKVTGMYSYSDGFFQRTVHYIADENGYRVVKEDVKKIGEGPQFNSGGRADVQGSLIGGYSIQIDDRERNPHYVGINQKN